MLPNMRHERFARLVAKGIPPYKAYPQAGYKEHPSRPYELVEKRHIQDRIQELGEQAMAASGLAESDIIDGLKKEAGLDGDGAKEGATRVRSLELLGKYLGMWKADRANVEGKSDQELRQEIVALVRDDPDLRAVLVSELHGLLLAELTGATGESLDLAATQGSE